MATSRDKHVAKEAKQEILHQLVCQCCKPALQPHRRVSYGKFECTTCGSPYMTCSEVKDKTASNG